MRNRIVTMNLNMEMFSLGLAFAACVTAFFGMNLVTIKTSDVKEYFFVRHILMIKKIVLSLEISV